MKRRVVLSSLLLACLLAPLLAHAAQAGLPADSAMDIASQDRVWKWWTIALCACGVVALMVAWVREKKRQPDSRHRPRRRLRRLR